MEGVGATARQTNSMPNLTALPKIPMHMLPSKQRSQFGRQTQSEKRTSPSVGFGTAQRFPPPEKSNHPMFISHDHSKQMMPDWTPGPGTYRLHKSVGLQIVSEKRTSPTAKFGVAYRFAQDEAERKVKCGIPAAWEYTQPSSVGRQPQSHKETSPTISFGTGTRAVKVSIGKGEEADLFGINTPGPAAHAHKSSFGQQPKSSNKDAPEPVFGTALRAIDPSKMNYKERRAAAIPGPGHYTQRSAIGSQVYADKQSMPQYSFSTCDRTRAGKSSLGRSQEKMLMGIMGPGPCTGVPVSSLGRQKRSATANHPAWRFGSQPRLEAPKVSYRFTPGPGSYVV